MSGSFTGKNQVESKAEPKTKSEPRKDGSGSFFQAEKPQPVEKASLPVRPTPAGQAALRQGLPVWKLPSEYVGKDVSSCMLPLANRPVQVCVQAASVTVKTDCCIMMVYGDDLP